MNDPRGITMIEKEHAARLDAVKRDYESQIAALQKELEEAEQQRGFAGVIARAAINGAEARCKELEEELQSVRIIIEIDDDTKSCTLRMLAANMASYVEQTRADNAALRAEVALWKNRACATATLTRLGIWLDQDLAPQPEKEEE
jgi:hypothetical protein